MSTLGYQDGFRVEYCASRKRFVVSVTDTGLVLGYLKKDHSSWSDWSWAKDAAGLQWDNGWITTGAVRMLLEATAPHPPSRRYGRQTALRLAEIIASHQEELEHEPA